MEDAELEWWRWCRLCAKESEDNISIFEDNTIHTAIGKFFWINIKSDDIAHYICKDCLQHVSSLVIFAEQVSKAQAMYVMLQNANDGQLDLQKVRSQFGLPEQIPTTSFCEDGKQEEANNEIENVEASIHQGDLEDDELECYSNARTSESENELFVKNDSTTYKGNAISRENLEEKPEQQNIKIEDDLIEAICYSEKNDHDSGSEEAGSIEDECNEDQSEEGTSEENNSIKDDIIEGRRTGKRLRRSIYANYKLRKMEDSDHNEESERRQENGAKYICKICGKSYKNAQSYRKHMVATHNTAADLPDFMCEKCARTFSTERLLSVHYRTHLPLKDKLVVPCPYCEKKFTVEAAMKQHVSSMHLNEKPYVCELCGQALKSLASFNDHKLVHTNECPYECDICSKRFKNKARLKAHMDIHTETGYTCNICNKQLNSKRTLKMHMLVHSEEKAYKCNFCGAEFKRGKALKNHLILHIGLRPYKCNFCNKTFTNGSNCRSHKKKAHPNELAAEEAAGLKSDPTNVPKIHELRASDNVTRPRPVKRVNTGMTPRMRALIKAAEEHCQDIDDSVTSHEMNEENRLAHYQLQNGSEEIQVLVEEIDDKYEQYEECEETVVYELVEESSL